MLSQLVITYKCMRGNIPDENVLTFKFADLISVGMLSRNQMLAGASPSTSSGQDCLASDSLRSPQSERRHDRAID
jgi:hypothetical protein